MPSMSVRITAPVKTGVRFNDLKACRSEVVMIDTPRSVDASAFGTPPGMLVQLPFATAPLVEVFLPHRPDAFAAPAGRRAAAQFPCEPSLPTHPRARTQT